MQADRPILLRVRGVGRRYAGVTALAGIDADVRSGEVLAIVGENGAGKSTLLKILSGVVEPSDGTLEVADARGVLAPIELHGVRDATRAGIALVHQELNLAENLDVAGSIYLGREPSRFGLLDRKRMRADAHKWLARVGLDIDPGTLCGTLPIAQRQLVEIAKALSTESRVLILDEPTSSLTTRETDRLLEIMDELRCAGVAVVFVSHHLDEVMKIADRVIVLRDGRKTGELARGEYDRATIERLMVGRDIAASERRGVAADAAVRLEVTGVTSAHRRKRPISFAVRAGEIVGLAGLVGAGRTEVLEAIAGVTPHGGEVRLDGAALVGGASARVRRGVAIVPEDRARNGLFLEDPVAMNMSLAWIDRTSRARIVDGRGEAGLVARMVARMQLRPPQPSRRVHTLSGGNQQKTVIGRWLAVDPKVLLLDEPTRGVDVGARAEIHAEVRRLAAAGSAVIFASSELEEVLLLADRILVMHEGAIAGELAAHEATEVAIMHFATGGAAHAHKTDTHA
ncbi:MAG: sugar ABC transporter ATP-binding protein [bacterium]